MRLLGQHEAAGARERIEARLGQRAELKLAVAVGEEREHEERQPVRRRFVERAEDARVVGVAGAALEQRRRLFAAIAAEMGMQQVHHRPQMAAFLDVDLVQVAQVVERRAGVAEQMLLLDRSGLGITLGDDNAAELRAVFARDLLPYRLAEGVAKTDSAIFHLVGEEDAPAVIGHFHRAILCPAFGVDTDGGAQVDVR